MTGAIVLAAGGSTRMGRPKQLLTFGGETLIHHATRSALDAGCSPVVVVLGAAAAECADAIATLPASHAINSDWSRGIGSSIRCGIKALLDLPQAARIDRVLISLVDQPHVNADFLKTLVAQAEQSSRVICASQFDDTTGPPVCIARSEFDSLATLPDDRGAKMLWAHRPAIVELIACPAAAIDIDRPEDYERLSRIGRD